MESAGVSRPARAHYRQQLDRTLHVFSNTILSFASIGPTGTVFAFVPIALLFGGSLTFVAFLIAAVVVVCQGLCYAECGTAYPIAGGEYAITARVVAKPVGAVLLADMIALYVFVPSAFALGGSIYLGVLWPWAGTHPHIIGPILLAIGAFVAFLRLAVGWIIAAIFLAVELVAIPVILVLGLVHAHNPIDRWFTNIGGYGPDGKPFTVTFTAMVLAITFAFFCYQGFGNALALSEETLEAKKKVGRAVMWTVLVAIVGIGTPVAALLLGAPSLQGLLTAPAPFTYFLTELGGKTVNDVVSLFVFFAILDAIVASTMAFGRVV